MAVVGLAGCSRVHEASWMKAATGQNSARQHEFWLDLLAVVRAGGYAKIQAVGMATPSSKALIAVLAHMAAVSLPPPWSCCVLLWTSAFLLSFPGFQPQMIC